MATEEKKFDSEELAKIKDLQTKYQTITAKMGQLEVDRLLLEQAMDRLAQSKDQLTVDYESTQSDEKQFVSDLNTKYGAGNVNIETGVFTPTQAAK
jgi:predicted nuclease with TOPRIM domain